MARVRLAWLGILTVAASLAWPALHARMGFGAFNVVFGVQMALYVAALVHVWRAPAEGPDARRDVVVILVFAVLLRAALVWQTPFLSDDVYRYIWDGRVQASGINPYRFVPGAQELSGLRDADVFPHINRRDYAHTIYPPAAQIAFLALHFVGGGTVAGWKIFVSLCDLGTIAMLARLVPDRRKLVVYAWHPLVCWETAHSGHIDAIAVALLVGALLASSRARRGLSGALLGLATLVKGYPLLVAPALLRRGGARFVLAFCAAFVLYLPYLGVGGRVLGFLPTYFREEGVDTGDRFVLLRVIRLVVDLPTWCWLGVVAGAFLVATVRILAVRDPDTPLEARHAATLAAMALALGTPHYAWYAVWLVALVCVAPRAAWLYLASAAAFLHYYLPHTKGPRLAVEVAQYVPLVVLLVLEARTRLRSLRESIRTVSNRRASHG